MPSNGSCLSTSGEKWRNSSLRHSGLNIGSSRLCYCTVSFTFSVWLTEPDVATTCRVVVPVTAS